MVCNPLNAQAKHPLEPNMEEKRRLKRRHLIFYLRVFNAQSDELMGYLVDLTSAGLMIMSEKPIESGKKYKLRMDLPKEYNERLDLEFDAESVWTNTDINPDFYNTGFKFYNVSQEAKQVIEDIIEDLGFENTE